MPLIIDVVSVLIVLFAVCIFFLPTPAVPESSSGCGETLHGDDGPDTFYGTSCGDTYWTEGGPDTAFGRDDGDALHMGAGDDDAHGGGGPYQGDVIWGGDNSTDNRETSYGGAGDDWYYDDTGPDTDRFCAGDQTDFADIGDGDGRDVFKGEANDYGHEDGLTGNGADGGDEVQVDGYCN